MGQSADSSPYVEPAQDDAIVPEYASIQAATNARLGDVEALTRAILVVVVVSIGAIVVGAVAIIMDQLHFNNELYRNNTYVHTRTIERTVHENSTQVIFPNVKTP